MDKIPLRTYLKDIENLIDKGENDPAIAHCRHILKAYPKNLATYRLLGKAYLECRRYGDAADVFQRVLSGVPDDFVSHVGMSIIREDESNQDAAIWHMERAFEIQPYNSAIQDELRRLYGRRDGLEPPKVRLTRGALARMYARGNLYQQAIGELRAALVEDPKRSDLQVLLARMYFMAGQKVEAVETCSTLLKKLPYCLEANRIISAILPETERKEETQVYRERVMSLDPYLVLASPFETTSDGVRDQVVVVEKLDYQEGQMEEAAQPAWAASLGVTFEEFKSSEEPIPDWLQAISDGQAPVGPAVPTQSPGISQVPQKELAPPETPFLSEEAELIPDGEGDDELPSWISFPDQPSGKVSPAASGEIPEWMKEAGWENSAGSAENSLPDFEYPEIGEIDDLEIEKGELPSWLQSLVPSNLEANKPGDEEAALSAAMPWLEQGGGSEMPARTVGEPDSDWLEELEAKPGEVSSEAPDWLKELDNAGAVEEADAETEAVGWEEVEKETAAEPELVSDMVGTPPVLEQADVFEINEEEGIQAEVVEEVFRGEAEPEEELPEWLRELGAEAEAGSAELGDLGAEASHAGKDLTDGLTGEALTDLQGEVGDEIPDWLKEADQDDTASADESEITLESVNQLAGDAEIAEFELPETELPIEQQEFETELAETMEEVEDFLEETEPTITGEEDSALIIDEQIESEAVQDEELPDWLKELEAGQLQQETGEAGVATAESGQAEPEEGLPDWTEETLPTVSEELSGESQLEVEEGFESFEASEDIPDWLREFGQEGAEVSLDEIRIDELDTGEILEQGEITTQEEIPAWLRDLEEENLGQAQEDVEPLPSLENLPAPELVDASDDEQDWLQIIGEKPLRAQTDVQSSEALQIDYSPEDIEALLADTQPIRVGKEEPAIPFNEILEDIDSERSASETAEFMDAHSEAESGSIGDMIGDAVPGVFGAALASTESEETFPGEEPMQVEAEQALPTRDEIPPFELDDQDTGMAWLESLAAKHGVSEEELFTSPGERPEAAPPAEDLVSEPEVLIEQSETVGAVLSEQEGLEPVDQGDEEGTGWTDEAAQAEVEPAEPAEVPDWLKEFEADDRAGLEEETEMDATAEAVESLFEVDLPTATTEPVQAEEYMDEEIPDWLRAVQSETEEELSQRQAEPGDIQEPELEDSDAAMAWLESLAAKQGVPEEELFTKPEDRSETPPGWIETEAEVAEETPQPVDLEAIESLMEDDELPEAQTGIQEAEPTPMEIDVEAAESLLETDELPVMQGHVQEAETHLPEIEVETIELPIEPEELPVLTAEAPEAEAAPSETRAESSQAAAPTADEPAPVEEPELPEWLTESDEGEAEDVEWAMPVEPVKAALREPRPGTSPLAFPPSQPVDINKASLVDLETMPGVGFILAQNILTYRDAFGDFQNLEDLVKVPGITPGIFAEIQQYFTVPPAPEPPKQVEPELLDEAQALLLIARNKLTEGDIEGTVGLYSRLLKNPELLPEIIRDLKEALYRFPVDINLWQILGDAYMRSDQLTEALEAYTKAEELLR